MSKMPINDFQMYVEDRGESDQREAVIFFNGSLSSANSWYPMLDLFEREKVRVVLHDYRGQRLSDFDDAPITYAQHADDANVMLEKLGIERVHIVGTSYGTVSAQRFAIDYPEKVVSMTLIEAFSEMDVNTENWVIRFVDWLKQAVDDESARARVYQNMLPLFFSPEFAAANREALEARAADFAQLPASFFQGIVRIYENQLANTPITSELHKIKVPTMVIWSEMDVLTPWALTQVIKENIPHAEVVKIPNTGHVAIAESPKLLESLMYGFIKQNWEGKQ